MKKLVFHDEKEYRADVAIEERQGSGTQRFELSYSAVFLPLEMIERAIRARVKEIYNADSMGVRWQSARIDASDRTKHDSSEYRNSNADQYYPDRAELRRIVRIKGSGFCMYAGPFKVEATCELFNHLDNGSGWESGKVTVKWVYALENPEDIKYCFRHFYDGGDVYTTRIEKVSDVSVAVS